MFATIELFEDLATGMTWRWERYVLGEDSEPEEKRPEPDTLDNCKFLIQNFMSTYAKPGSSDGLKFQAQGEVLLVNIMLIMRAAHAAATGYDRGSGKVSGEPVPESEKKAFKEVSSRAGGTVRVP